MRRLSSTGRKRGRPFPSCHARLAVTSAIEQLPAHYRAVLVLRDVEGLLPAEVAEALCISLSTAKSRIHRARLLIRKRLTEFATETTDSKGLQPA